MVSSPKQSPYRRFYTKNRTWQELVQNAKEKQTKQRFADGQEKLKHNYHTNHITK